VNSVILKNIVFALMTTSLVTGCGKSNSGDGSKSNRRAGQKSGQGGQLDRQQEGQQPTREQREKAEKERAAIEKAEKEKLASGKNKSKSSDENKPVVLSPPVTVTSSKVRILSEKEASELLNGKSSGGTSAATSAGTTSASRPTAATVNPAAPSSSPTKLSPAQERMARNGGTTPSQTTVSQPSASTTQAPAVKSENKVQASPDNRKLPAEVIFSNELSAKSTESERKAIQEVLIKVDLKNAYAATPVSDHVYGITVKSKEISPAVSTALWNAIIPSSACDLNTVGACVVFEKDSASGKTVNSAYYVGSAQRATGSQSMRIARRDVSMKTLSKQVDEVLKNKADGIYIFSPAESRAVAEQLQAEAIEVEDIKNLEAEASQQNAKIKEAQTDEEKRFFENQVAEIVAKSTYGQKREGSNALLNYCHVRASLKMVKRFIIADIVRTKVNEAGVKEYVPTKVGKGHIFCQLKDGRKEMPKIVLKDYQALRVGVALSHATQELFATGIGWANGALDILMMREFGYIIQADAQALVGGVSVSPIILSGRKDRNTPMISGMISVVPHWMLLNVNVTLTGWYEIGIDPDDT
jgi:hypothetical protein